MRPLRTLSLALWLPLLLPCACQSRGQDRPPPEASRGQPSPHLSGVLSRRQALEGLGLSGDYPSTLVGTLDGGVEAIRRSPRYPGHDVYLYLRFSGDDTLVDGWNVTPAATAQGAGAGGRAALSAGGG